MTLEHESAESLRERFDWKKVVAPKVWRPKYNGEELIGFYGGRTVRNGQFGQYEVVLIHVPQRGAFVVNGVRIIQLIDAALITPGHAVRIVWRGMMDLGDDKKMRSYDVFVAEGKVRPDALPEIEQ